MLVINVRVPKDRDHAAVVEVKSGMSTIARGLAAASASPEIAAIRGNTNCDPMRPWGHPAAGGYQLIAQGLAPDGCQIEYGRHLFAFQPVAGDALDAESFGRLTLLMYAGTAAREGGLRRTQGGIRLDQGVMDALVARLAPGDELVMHVDVMMAPAWWQFWRRPEVTLPLAPDAPHFRAPPLDEASLAEALSAGKRLARRARFLQEDDTRAGDNSTSSSSGSSSGSEPPYSGKGGGYGGAGGSGSWNNAPSALAGRGTDGLGGLAAGVAAAAVLDPALASQESGIDTTDTDTTDTTGGTNY